MNVGPTAEGVIPQASQDNLRAAGRWLKVNGAAVYGAGPSPFGEEFGEWTAKDAKDVRGQKLFLANNDYRVTTKPGKLFITFFTEPRVPFEIPAMKNKLVRAYRLADKAPMELKVEANGRTSFLLERPMLDSMATVVVVEFEGPQVNKWSDRPSGASTSWEESKNEVLPYGRGVPRRGLPDGGVRRRADSHR